MKTTRLLATVLIMSLCCSFVHGQAKPDTPTADEKAVIEALTKVRELKATSYHLFLREAAQIFPQVCVGREWSDVTNILDKQECPIVESWGNGKRRYYLVREKAFSFENGSSLDAYIWLSADDSIPRNLQASSPRVFQADIVLAANVNAPSEDLIAQRRFPRNSVLDVVLCSKEVQRGVSRWPLVKTIFVNYGSIIGRWGSASGFEVTVECAASLEKRVGGERMYFFVRSGLDPVKLFSNEVASPDVFTPKDSLGEVTGYGGNEWWHGNTTVIEANKKKYLKPHE